MVKHCRKCGTRHEVGAYDNGCPVRPDGTPRCPGCGETKGHGSSCHYSVAETPKARGAKSAKEAARMRQPMTRAEVHALMMQNNQILLNALNELEGRIQALEPAGERRTAGGLVLPPSMQSELTQ